MVIAGVIVAAAAETRMPDPDRVLAVLVALRRRRRHSNGRRRRRRSSSRRPSVRRSPLSSSSFSRSSFTAFSSSTFRPRPSAADHRWCKKPASERASERRERRRRGRGEREQLCPTRSFLRGPQQGRQSVGLLRQAGRRVTIPLLRNAKEEDVLPPPLLPHLPFLKGILLLPPPPSLTPLCVLGVIKFLFLLIFGSDLARGRVTFPRMAAAAGQNYANRR